MITLLVGKKGSGKTKRLIAQAKEALETTKGHVVVIEKGKKLTYDISHKARLIDADDYHIESVASLYGFVCGICSANYDVTDVFIDGTLKIMGNDVNNVGVIVDEFKKVKEIADVNIVLSISAGDDEIPAELAEYVKA